LPGNRPRRDSGLSGALFISRLLLKHLRTLRIANTLSSGQTGTLIKLSLNKSKNMSHNDDLIPNQRVGNKLDAVHKFEGSTQEEARKVFSRAAERMLNVNNWEKICGPLSAKFELTDESGEPVSRTPRPGDHFKIDVPGPGPSAGDGFDWVRVEVIEDRRNPMAIEESITMRVRPASSPENAAPDTAHFFKDEATSSFRVTRHGHIVTAEVHGRNEVPNTEANTTKDKVRNAVVGTGAVAGVSKPQWESLVKGLLDS
jgi:hypothetical protein